MTKEGDKDYTSHSVAVILQYIVGIMLFCICSCLVRQEEKRDTQESEQKQNCYSLQCLSDQYLVPLLLTIGLLLTIPLNQVLPNQIL